MCSDRGLIAAFAILLTGTIGFFIVSKIDTQVSALPRKIIQVESGAYHSTALDSIGMVYTWGDNSSGQLGNGTTTGASTPTPVVTAGTPMAGKKITSISTSGHHTLALASDGAIYAWGRGGEGQLGNDEWVDKTLPGEVEVSNTPMADKTIVAVSAGAFHSFALASDGTVYAWGRNDYGQLGNDTNQYSAVPVSVVTTGTPMASKAVISISAGGFHTLALTSDGIVYGWGRNNNGQVGDNTTTARTKPVAVSVSGTTMAGKTITSVAAGTAYSHAVSTEGLVYSWGYNSNGQLGDNTTNQRNRPASVSVTTTPMNGKFITSISAGDAQSLALASDGTMYSWGDNIAGHLGDGTNTERRRPVAVVAAGTPMAGKAIASISMQGDEHTIVLASDGAVYSWGGNSDGQLGNGTTTGSYTAVQTSFSLLSTPSVPRNIAATSSQGSVILNWTAPIELYGQSITGYSLQYRTLGNATWTTVSISGAVTSHTQTGLVNAQKYQVRLAAVTAAGVGNYSSIMLTEPRNMTITSISPNAGPPAGGQDVTITGTDFALKDKDIIQIASGYSHMLALGADGAMYAWGSNSRGQLGDGTSTQRNYPIRVVTTGTPIEGKRVVKVAAGYDTSFAITSDGKLYSWGENNHGQLGRGSVSIIFNPTPQEVVTAGTPMSGKKIVDIVSNQATTLALDSDGVLYSWGYNEHGELGQGTAGVSVIVPALVKTTGTSIQGKRITAVSAGEYYFLVIDNDGLVHSWGRNLYGELGNNTQYTFEYEPTAVVTAGTPMAGKVIVGIAGSMWHSMAVDSNGNVYTWGDNEYGQLGDGTAVSSYVPVAVNTANTPMAGKKITSVTAGGNDFFISNIEASHSVAVAEDGTMYTWGENYAGELGDGTTTRRTKPVAVDVSGTSMAGKQITQASGGIFYTAALSSDGKVYAWGSNSNGQLGDNSTTNRTKPVATSTTAPSALAQSSPIVTFDGIQATNVSLVNSTTIAARTPAHAAGTVDVVANLGDGDTRYTATLTNGYIYGTSPGAPTALAATPRDNGVQLNWTAPASNGGSAIIDYVIQYSADNGITWNTYADGIAITTNTLVPTPMPLNAGTTYTFRVAAVNGIGQGAWSNTATGRVRYITISSPTSLTVNVTPTGGARMSSLSQNVTVSTNGVLGYQLLLGAGSSERNLVNGSSTIAPTTGTQATPITLANSSWGYRVPGIGGFGNGSGVETNTTVSSYTWAGIPAIESPAVIRTRTTAITNQSTTVWYGVSVTSGQRSGAYTGTVTYTAVTRD